MISYANAKINIGLNVVAKRANGYHSLETIFYPYPLYDIIELTDKPTGNKVSLEITGLDLPVDDNNLCLRAFRLLEEEYHIPAVHIQLHKQIPFGAGLGGGSSDAAFLLKMLNEKFQLALSDEQLEAKAAQLGADCPFFIKNRPAYAEGIGTELSDILLDLSSMFLVLVKPVVSVPTAEAYQQIVPRASTDSLLDLIKFPVQDWKYYIKNDFEEGVFGLYPVIRDIKLALYAQGALYASMSGSGSAVYGIFSEQVDLKGLESLGAVFYQMEL